VKILVTGAGIIGSTYGWALSQAEHEVAHFVRPGKAARLRTGITMDVFDRRKGRKRYFHGQYLLRATEAISPSDGYELVVVPTKHYQLEDALVQLAPQADRADFVLLTQNWRGGYSIDSVLPRGRYVFGDAKAGGTYSAGTLVSTLKSLDLGPAEGQPTALARKLAAVFESAGIPTTLHQDMLHHLWVQYAIAGGLWPAVVRAGSVDSVLRDRRVGEMAMAAVRECLEVVARRGVDLGEYPETRPFLRSSGLRRRIGIWLVKVALRYSEYTRRSSAHALEDATEIKTFYDDLMTTGKELGVPMPVMSGYSQDIASFVEQHR
jgi:2-dehydropantoate 2-reductase